MLVTFKSSAFGDITMFGDVAKSLLKLMGQSGEIPGAVVGDDVSAALGSLRENLSRVEPDQATTGDTDEDGEQSVSLSTRANPLIKALEAAAEAKADVIWES